MDPKIPLAGKPKLDISQMNVGVLGHIDTKINCPLSRK